MHVSLTRGPIRVLDLWLLCSCYSHVYGQYPGSAGSPHIPPIVASTVATDPYSAQPGWPYAPEYSAPQSNLELLFPADNPPNSGPARAVSVAELQHPLSRKGRRLMVKAENDLIAGKNMDVLVELHNALKEPSAVPYAHSLLGAAYLEAGRLPEAISELQQAVQLLPISANYCNLGYAHCLTGDVVQGEKELRQALELDRTSPWTRYFLGVLLLDSKPRNREACEHLERAVRAAPKAHIALAVCYVRVGQEGAADQQVSEFAGRGNESKLVFWKSWVRLIASEPQPSIAFGLRSQPQQ
jgi:tetratricopeptide (TPR) repeat protein